MPVAGDFPNLERFVESIRDYDFTKFPKTDSKLLEEMERVLSVDVPQLMNTFPTERQDGVEVHGGADVWHCSSGACG